ncbi:MAG: hypothetical protein LBS01_09495 [Prevotellaceae bacterium]|jgi:hypothetical protein|nr:hypothetical protein [Prevotellaceae bacterium]
MLFPPEIIHNSAHTLFARRNSKTWVVYLAVAGAAASNKLFNKFSRFARLGIAKTFISLSLNICFVSALAA